MSTEATASTATIILLSACSFVGNIGAAVTGFGQAIIYLLVWQIVELAGYDGNFKYAVFIQALSLFSMQPLLLYKANVIKHAYRYILLLFVPVTLISTPLGQLVSDQIPTKIVQAVGGVLVTFVACFEIFNKREWFLSFCKKKEKTDEDNAVAEGGDTSDKKTTGVDVEKGTIDDKNDAATKDETTTQSKKPNKVDEFDDNPSKENKSSNPKPRQNNDVTSKTTPKYYQEFSAINVQRNENDNKNEESLPSVGEATSGSKTEQDKTEQMKIGFNKATFWTLLAGGSSGFLGGLVAIRGPPLIFYFLHPPHPVSFNKNSQRSTGVVIMFFNVFMRQVFYLINTFSPNAQGKIGYQKEDWRLYLSVIICSIAGGMVGAKLFEYVKDSKDTIRGILSVFLFLCGVSLLFSAFR